jgi:6-phospho-3-hexuloisomerase
VSGDIQSLANAALDEVRAVLTALTSEATDSLIREITGARRLALYGVGREGLMMKAFAMRLYHLGLDAHVVGDMTTPPVGDGDLLIASAGPGAFSTVLALMSTASAAGARTAVITAQPQGQAAQQADAVIHLPAQTMADDQGGQVSVLPMGSLYETAQLIFFELVILQVRDNLGETAASMRERHTNLE